MAKVCDKYKKIQKGFDFRVNALNIKLVIKDLR